MHFCLPGQIYLYYKSWLQIQLVQVNNCSPGTTVESLLLPNPVLHMSILKGCLKLMVDQNLWLLQV